MTTRYENAKNGGVGVGEFKGGGVGIDNLIQTFCLQNELNHQAKYFWVCLQSFLFVKEAGNIFLY